MRRPPPLRALLDALATFAMFAAFGLLAAMVLAACSGKRLEAAPERSSATKHAMPDPEPAVPSIAVAPVATDRLCVTKGAAVIGRTVTEPTMRAVALGSSGDAAALRFIFRGETEVSRELASGEARRQLGLKLRAQDGCNLVYVMWRLDPKPSLEVSLKRNPGMRNHRECGANGYARVKPATRAPVPALAPGAEHTLRAEISGEDLLAWIDDHLVWRGPLPAGARALAGPAGLRSDNLSFDLVAFSAPPAGSSAAAPAKCSPEHGD
ncbi:MAG TPA: hypothetical protein VN253_13280 [Kofleriaceae bacterium]|nr:hypothetical protein [Kofleriaceae bacterium]